jgi:DNA-binding transcriptional MocR family regulator
MEALNLAIRAVAKPGNVIAVESPSYFGVLQVIESMGMRALEVPTHPREGLDLEALETAIHRHRVKACVAIPTCHNPLGFVMPDSRKEALVRLLARHEIPLIEDDVYGDLAFAETRPRAAKSFDRDGGVLLCGSFSKSIAPGLRVGWIHPGRFQGEVERLKLLGTLATASLPQWTVARFLESGGYDRHLRRLRVAMARQVELVSQAVARYFPPETCVSRPEGGFVVWVELPEGYDTVALHQAALDSGISISPGPIFSASGRFRHCLRLNCGSAWCERIDRGLLTLGRLAEASRA